MGNIERLSTLKAREAIQHLAGELDATFDTAELMLKTGRERADKWIAELMHELGTP